MDVISTARKEHQQVTQFEVRINASRSRDHIKLLIRALISYLVTGENVAEAVLLRLILNCQIFPVAIHACAGVPNGAAL